MRLLWIPHTPWSRIGHRSRFVIEKLRSRHEIHVVTWSEPAGPSPLDFSNPLLHLKAMVSSNGRTEGVIVHHIPRLLLHRLPLVWAFNQPLFEREIRRIVRDDGIEAIVCGQSAYLIGFLPRDCGVPVVFDYSDYTESHHLDEYVARATAIVCASRALQKQVQARGIEAEYIPNGVDLERLRKADGQTVRERYDLGGVPLISLIGLTCSPDLYFVSSLYRVRREVPEARFLFVGKGPLYRPLRRALKGMDSSCVWAGWVPPQEVYDYFKATDIGTYPGADNEYFRSACPIKLLEYAAAGKTAVSSPVDEIGELGLRNIIVVEANSSGFLTGLRGAIDSDRRPEKAAVPTWAEIAARFEQTIATTDRK